MADSHSMSGQPIPAPRFRLVSGSDIRSSSPYNPPPKPNIKPSEDTHRYMYQHDNNNFQRPRMQYQGLLEYKN